MVGLVVAVAAVAAFSSLVGWLMYGLAKWLFPDADWLVQFGVACGLGAALGIALLFVRAFKRR